MACKGDLHALHVECSSGRVPAQAQQLAALHAAAAAEARAELEVVRRRTGASIRGAAAQARELAELRLLLRKAEAGGTPPQTGARGPGVNLSHVDDVAGLRARIAELAAQLAAEQRMSAEAGALALLAQCL
jgi:hypothetical protein